MICSLHAAVGADVAWRLWHLRRPSLFNADCKLSRSPPPPRRGCYLINPRRVHGYHACSPGFTYPSFCVDRCSLTAKWLLNSWPTLSFDSRRRRCAICVINMHVVRSGSSGRIVCLDALHYSCVASRQTYDMGGLWLTTSLRDHLLRYTYCVTRRRGAYQLCRIVMLLPC